MIGVILNPVIYGALNSDYRGAFMQILRTRFGTMARNNIDSSAKYVETPFAWLIWILANYWI